MNGRSIQVRLTLWYTALILAVALAFGAYTYLSLQNRLYDQMQETLARRVYNLRDDILPQAFADPVALAQQIKDVYSPEESSRFIRITPVDEKPLYVSGEPKDHSFDPSTIPSMPEDIHGISSRLLSSGGGASLYLTGLRANVAGKDFVIEMGSPTDHIEDALRKLLITLLVGLPFVAVIAIAGGSLLIRRSLQPVESVRAAAEKITFSNTAQRLPATHTGDAIEHLTYTLNQMLERLDLSYQQASRFSADASHELRTPLSIVRSELESVVQSAQTPQFLKERLGSVLEEIERLSVIVGGLSSIAHLDAGEAKIAHDRLDIAEIVRTTVEQMQLLADEKNISVAVIAPNAFFVMGDKARLKQVVVNLLDNAVKYTHSGGAIELSVNANAALVCLQVSDNGPGVPANALPFVFERFYRAEKVRSSGVGGAGLGLSIVQAICQAHGGTIAIESTEGDGTKVIVTLPLAEERKNAAI